jgi:SAM-dependent methyltransferase
MEIAADETQVAGGPSSCWRALLIARKIKQGQDALIENSKMKSRGGRMIKRWLLRISARASPPAVAKAQEFKARGPDAVENYWTSHNVTGHRIFGSAQASIEDFNWRNAQYFGYIDLMPVSGADNLHVLDFGCGPGYDLVGFATQSLPARLVGVDVSTSSLAEARQRLALHDVTPELVHHDVNVERLPFEDGSFDLVHSSGVLHHMPDERVGLRELRRLVQRGGVAQIMVYNYSSLWVHLYVAYQRQIIERIGANDRIADAFCASTDGPDCPISRAYMRGEFVALARQAGFALQSFGAAVSAFEMSLLPRRFDAIMDPKLPRESREFLANLTFDSNGLPSVQGVHAGIAGCYRFHAI